MNDENKEKKPNKRGINVGKECAYLAVFVALVIAMQLCLAFLPGVEVVTLLFVAYAFVFGGQRGMLAATAFSILRQLVFGFFPLVLILYLVYYNLLTLLFGWLGKRVKNPIKALWLLTVIACLCTVCFSLFDAILTPVWFGYTWNATKAYFIASLSFMLPQVVCTVVTIGVLFLPLRSALLLIKRGLQ